MAASSQGTWLVTGNCDGDLRIGASTFPAPANAPSATFLATIDPDGVPQRVQWFHGRWTITAAGFDAQDGIHVLGVIDDPPVDLGDGPLAGPLFVAELDANGRLVRSRNTEAELPSRPAPVAFGPAGHVAFTDYDGVRVVAPDGSVLIKTVSGDSWVAALSFDRSGNLGAAGQLENHLDWIDPPLVAPFGGYFVASLDPEGHGRWARAPDIKPSSLASSQGRLFMGGIRGWITDTIVRFTVQALDAGSPTGTIAWTTLLGPASLSESIDVAALPDGGVVAIGALVEAVDLGLGWLDPPGSFVTRLDATGRVIGAAAFRNEGGTTDATVASDARGGILIASYFRGALDIGNATLIADEAPEALFLVKLLPEPASLGPPAGCPMPPSTLLAAPSPLRPSSVAVAGDTVVLAAGNQIVTLPVSGGKMTLVAHATRPVAHLRADARSIYWATSPSTLITGTVMSDAEIASVAIGGGAPTVLADNLGPVADFAVGGDHLYWASDLAPHGTSTPLGKLLSVSLVDHQIDELAAGFVKVGRLAAIDGFAVLAASPVSPGQTELLRISATGGRQTLVLTDHLVSDLLIDGEELFWLEQQTATAPSGRLLSVPLAGGAPTVHLEGLANPTTLVASAGSLFYVDMDHRKTKSLYRLQGTAPPASPEALGFVEISPLAADAQHVVWLEVTDEMTWTLRARSP